MAETLEHRRYVCADGVDANHNKFWYVTLFDDATVKVEFGRVGARAQTKTHSKGSTDAARKFMEKKCAEKTKPRKAKDGHVYQYKRLDVVEAPTGMKGSSAPVGNIKDLAAEQIESNDAEVKKLIALMVDNNIHQILGSTKLTYDKTSGLFSTPLGVISQKNIDEARKILANIQPFVIKQTFANRRAGKLLNDYLMLVPQDIGRHKPSLDRIIPDVSTLQKQTDILDGLQGSLDIIIQNKTKKKTTKKKNTGPKAFNVSMNLVRDKAVFERARKKFDSSVNRHHEASRLKMVRLYEIEIKQMREAFSKDGHKIGNVQELWHGTSTGNLLSILSKGLIIPSHASNGRMYGNGVYFSDQSTKALNYSYGYWNGRKKSKQCFMFLCSVAMGKPYMASRGWGSKYPRAGHDSTFAKAGSSGVINNEMIVYRLAQCDIMYLAEFEE